MLGYIQVKVMLLLSVVMIITSCAKWSSVPKVVDQNYSKAFHAMVKNQTLCTEHGVKAKDAKLCPEHVPVVAMDGQKAQKTLEAYRQGALVPLEDAKKGVVFDTKNVGGSGGGN